MLSTSWIALAAFAAALFLAARRNRLYAVFALIMLGIPTFVQVALGSELGPLAWVLAYLHLAGVLHFVLLAVRPKMRPAWFRWGVSIPGLYFIGASLPALPWAVVASIDLPPYGWWFPFGLALGGLWQSLRGKEETVPLVLDGADAGALQRWRSPPAPSRGEPLRIVQITDPHLGPFMSVARLRRICERAVARDPDLILITGDLMTMESQDVDVVTAALEPLAAARGRVFACHGNHDHEARAVVATAFARHGIELLVDAEAVVRTRGGPVQILGADFVWRGRDVHLAELARRYPRRPEHWRLWLLHDPGAFFHLPAGEGDLVLSGHTHGGQIGLLSLGGRGTVVSATTRVPDHGFWARGRNRLYVHRAQGHYGYPIRLGVPSEQSLLEVHRAR